MEPRGSQAQDVLPGIGAQRVWLGYGGEEHDGRIAPRGAEILEGPGEIRAIVSLTGIRLRPATHRSRRARSRPAGPRRKSTHSSATSR